MTNLKKHLQKSAGPQFPDDATRIGAVICSGVPLAIISDLAKILANTHIAASRNQV